MLEFGRAFPGIWVEIDFEDLGFDTDNLGDFQRFDRVGPLLQGWACPTPEMLVLPETSGASAFRIVRCGFLSG